jgi:geranylgeranyl diphosphate synthase, type I
VPTPPASLSRLRARIDAALAAYLDEALPRIVALHDGLAPLAAELREFVVGGGKRVRPALLLTGFRAGGGPDVDLDDAMGPALALELLHTCALLHDDIIDAAPTRRGRPTTHVTFAAAHRDAGWAGDADLHGTAVAILLGDLAFVQADELFLTAGVPADRLLAGLRRFTLLREEVMAGQVVDLQAAASRTTSRDLALAVATYKSGRYSVARPLEVGAVLAGADDALVAGLHAVGDPLGRAFQVRDDLLGVFGSHDETGKSVVGDLVEGKRTLLVAETAVRLDGEDLATFERLLGSADLDAAGAEVLRDLMRRSGGLAATEAYVEAEVSRALEALDTLDVDDTARTTLAEMAAYLGDRSA